MKRIVFSIFALCICHFAYADTVNVNWLNADGTTYSTSTCTVGGDIVVPQTPPTKYGYTFVGWNIPYTPIEYLESTGTQYIDTGYYVTDITNLTVKIKIQATKSGTQFLFGANNNANTDSITQYSMHANNNTYYLSIKKNGGAADPSVAGITIAGPVIFEITRNSMIANGQTQTISYNSSNLLDLNLPIRLFGWSASTGNYFGNAKVYYFQIWQNGTLVRDMIPVIRNSDGVVGMYDRVNSTFYANAGTGDFVAGPEI